MKGDAMLPELLLLPGLLCDGRLWAAQTEGLASLAASRTPDLAPYESIAAMAEAVLEQAPLRFSMAGFSMGGCVALEVVARAPERVGRLALLSTNAKGLLPAVRRHYLDSIAGIAAGGLDSYLLDAFPLYVAPERAHDRPLWDTFNTMAHGLGSAVAARQMRSLLEYPGFLGDLGRIACPTAVICGRQDRRIPVAVHEELAGRIPGARLRVIERAGHFTPLEEPQAVTDALRDWLHTPIYIIR
jgi:pimeloyl-ACP methyl ester carboxylesterase